jgi:2',3'-cyclic-nucleotide 2'-phosphodiesterase (5'-nucleotidase family)
MKKATILILIMLIILSISAASEELTVVYTANSNGKLKTCGCPDDPYGALSERVTLIKQLRINSSPFLLVDGGNMVDIFGDFNQKLAIVMKLMNIMGYDAAGAGFNELYNGIESTEKIRDAAGFSILALGIGEKSGKELFKPYIIKKVGMNSVAVIGICEKNNLPQIGNPKFDGFEFTNAESELEKVLKEINGKADYVILLSQESPEKNITLLNKFKSISVIVEDCTNKKYDNPVIEGGGVIVSPGKYGRFVGILKVLKSGKGVKVKSHEFIKVLDIPQDKDAMKLID